MIAAGLTGIVWKRGNNTGALCAIVIGIVLGLIMMFDSLAKDSGGFIPLLQRPILSSFMHRSFVAFAISVFVMVAVSKLTSPPPKERVEGICFEWTRSIPPQKVTLIQDSRLWATLLFVLFVSCCAAEAEKQLGDE